MCHRCKNTINPEEPGIPVCMHVSPLLRGTDHHELMVVRIGRVPVATDIIGGVVYGQRVV